MKSSELITNAKLLLGKKYVWGGESDAEGGYDCSGFLYAALTKSGYKTSRLTAQGFSNIGKSIYLSQIKAGDLVFFGTSTSKITHCAIYLGNDKMIESVGTSNNTKSNPGKGVTISSLYRRLDLQKARRVCNDIVETRKYTTGETYTVVVDNLNIRTSPSTAGRVKSKNELTTDGKKVSNAKGQLMNGTKVTCKATKYDTKGNLWMQIPSGWIACIYNDNIWVV